MKERNLQLFLQPLPIGLGHFETLRKANKLYVDKTDLIYNLVNHAPNFYFLSRPRRFGKTLLCTAIKALYEGKRELFKDLAIDKLWSWNGDKTQPVIHMDMSICETKDYFDLESRFLLLMEDMADCHNVEYKASKKTARDQFKDLINQLYNKTGKKVVILIDEYDKPIHPFIGDTHSITLADGIKEKRAYAIRDKLADFYSVLKAEEGKIEFLLLTGVSRLARTNLFSKLNNITDISYDPNYGTLLGYTHLEVKKYFNDYICRLAHKRQSSFEDIWNNLVDEYNGYNFHEECEQVFNPFSLLQVLNSQNFDNYWYTSGMPTMLVNILRDNPISPKKLENAYISGTPSDSLDLENPNLISLMLQTGYLTIDERDGKDLRLRMPNNEVSESLLRTLACDLSNIRNDMFVDFSRAIKQAFLEDDMEGMFLQFNALITSIPYEIMKKMERESQFHLIFYLIIKMLGFKIPMEQSMLGGRIDAIVETPKILYIFEFKINKDPGMAIEQIQKRRYMDPFINEKNRKIVLLGISAFSDGSKIKFERVDI